MEAENTSATSTFYRISGPVYQGFASSRSEKVLTFKSSFDFCFIVIEKVVDNYYNKKHFLITFLIICFINGSLLSSF